MPLTSILAGSGAFHLFMLSVLAFLALVLGTGIVIGRYRERRANSRQPDVPKKRDRT